MTTRSKSSKAFVSSKHPITLPSSAYYEIAKPSCCTEASKIGAWRQAMSEEFSALQRQGTWTLIPYSDKHRVGCKWVYKLKHDQDGSIARYKA